MNSVSPPVGQAEPPFELMDLNRVRPKFCTYDKSYKTLDVLRSLPDPMTVSPSSPKVVNIRYTTPGSEPDIGWYFFVKGVATFADIVPDHFQQAISDSIRDTGERIMEGEGLPELDETFANDVQEVIRVILNADPISIRSLIAFTAGVYWLLSFTRDPEKRRGRYTPRSWAKELTTNYATLSYLPD